MHCQNLNKLSYAGHGVRAVPYCLVLGLQTRRVAKQQTEPMYAGSRPHDNAAIAAAGAVCNTRLSCRQEETSSQL